MKLKMYFSFIVLAVMSLAFTNKANQGEKEFKEALVNGAVFRWKIENNEMVCELKVPTPGWVGVGFKKTSGVVQNNLIIGSFDSGLATCEDHTVVNVRNHLQVEELGGSNALNSCDVTENEGYTTLYFSLPTVAIDGYHYNFEEGEEMFVTISYSRTDDFMSHPVRRVQIRIIL